MLITGDTTDRVRSSSAGFGTSAGRSPPPRTVADVHPWPSVADPGAADAGASLDAASDAALVAACGEEPSWFCEAAWKLTENRLVAQAADWVITRPLVAILIVIGAAILNRVLRRAVTALVERLVVRNRMQAAQALGKLAAVTGVTGLEKYAEPLAVTAADAREDGRAETLSAVSRASVSAIIWSAAVMMILQLFGFELAPLIASAGIAGVAIGFGAQSLVRDCISGFFMLLEDQCGVGDEVDLGHASGTVESVTLRTTQVRGVDGTLWTVPNGAIVRVGNRTRNWSKGFVDVGVPHDADFGIALTAIERAVDEVGSRPEVIDVVQGSPTVMGLDRIEPNGLWVRVAVQTNPGDHWGVMRHLRVAIKRELDGAGIDLSPLAGR
jgi:small conductance mechanosensitive channel